jgi:hypothetical protein
MTEVRANKAEKAYDKIMRENLELPGQAFLNYFFPGEKIIAHPLPNRLRQHIKEFETDTTMRVEIEGKDPFIFHLEYQSSNDRSMAKRMAVYDFMLHQKYNMDVIGVVIYAGEQPMEMSDTVAFSNNFYHCQLVNLHEIDPLLFLNSDRSREIIFAILASYPDGESRIIVRKILSKLHELLPYSPIELKDRIKELEILSNLRGDTIHQQIIEEEQKMVIYYDLTKDLRYKQGKSEGESEALLKVAKRLIRRGEPISVVSKLTGLRVSVLKEAVKRKPKAL